MTTPRPSLPAARPAPDVRSGPRLPAGSLERLAAALRTGDVPALEQALAALEAGGLDRGDLVCEVLGPLADRLLDAAGTELDRRRVVQSVRAAVHRLRTWHGRRGRVVLLAVDDRGSLGLELLALGLERHGLLPLLADGLPEAEALALAAAPGLRVVCLGAGTPAGTVRAQALAARLRPGVTTVVSPRAATGLGAVLSALVELADPLSERERATLALVAQGLTNAQIGQALGVSTGAVKARLDSAFDKLGATDRASAVALAMRAGSLR